MTPVLVLGAALCAAGATMTGGLLALRLANRLPLVLAFSAGAVIGVALFDLAPEALAAGQGRYDGHLLLAVVALGFFLYVLVDGLLARHDGKGARDMPATARGPIGAASFSAHSVMDGFAMGIALQAGSGIGLAVAAAVLAHDFADGLNTVNVVMRHGGQRKQALSWLAMVALAPVLGAALSLMITPHPGLLAILLALFCGFFLHIGAASLLPDSRRARPGPATAAATLAGAGFLYLVTLLVP